MMIEREDLLAMARFKGLSPQFAELDYVQDIALIHIYKEFGDHLVFKGGTCLYKVYQLNRFSEDLDFTATKGFKAKDFFHRLPYFFDLLNIKSRVNIEKFEKGTNVYLEISGPLYNSRKETRVTLIFNISFRERILLPIERCSYRSVYGEIRPFELFAMSEKEILAEKVRAIYGRNKARDVYDLWYLLIQKQHRFEAEFVNKKLVYDKTKFEKEKFLSKIDEKKTSWERDLAALIAGTLPPFDQVKKDIIKAIG